MTHVQIPLSDFIFDHRGHKTQRWEVASADGVAVRLRCGDCQVEITAEFVPRNEAA